MIYLLIILGTILFGSLIWFLISLPEENTHGFPYPLSKEFKERYEEEQKIRQQIVREHGIAALNAYLNAGHIKDERK